MTDIQEIKCAKCRVPLQGNVVDTKPQDRFACPRCGQGDTYENVMREIGEYALNQVAESIAAGFKKALRGDKFMTFTKYRRSKKRYRFVTNLDL